MPERFLRATDTYKKLCDNLVVGYSDIIDLVENNELHPRVKDAKIKEISSVLIRFYEAKSDEIEESEVSQYTCDNVVSICTKSRRREIETSEIDRHS